jgi:hypothetical protein
MTVIRGGLLVITSIMLFLALLIANVFLVISLSLTYDNVNKEAIPAIKDAFSDQIRVVRAVNNEYPIMQQYCQNYPNYVLDYEKVKVVVPCTVILQGQDSVVNFSVSEFIDEVYFTNYDCSFFQCFKQYKPPFFIVSKMTQDDFYSRFNLMLIAIGILCVIGFILSEKKSNFFLLISMLIVLSVLPFWKLEWLIVTFGANIQPLLLIFFSKSFFVFKTLAIVGASLFVIGLILKLFTVGFNLSTIFSKSPEQEKKEKKEKEKQERKEKRELEKNKAKKKLSKKKSKRRR